MLIREPRARWTGLILMFILANGPAFAADAVTCKQFSELDAGNQSSFASGLLDGMRMVRGLLDSNVLAAKKAGADPAVVKGTELSRDFVARALTTKTPESRDTFTHALSKVCAEAKYSDLPTANAALDLLMGIAKVN